MNADGKKTPQVTIDVSARRIARVYAEALLNAADRRQQSDAVLEELRSLVRDVFERDPRLEVLLSSAALGRKARQEAIEKAFAGKTSEIFFNFLLTLNDHERLELLRAILEEAEALYMQRRGQLSVLVRSAVPLPDHVRQQLVERIRARFQREPVLEEKVEPELLGGMKIRIGDLQVDATASTYLENLKKYFLARSSHEIQSRRDRFSSAE